LWNLLIQQLNKEGTTEYNKIHTLNRAQLIDDSFHMARAGLLDFDTTFGVMNYLEKETDYIPWTPANRANTLLNRWLTGTAVYPHYQTFMRKNVQALFTRLGTNIVNNEQRVDRYARTVAINIACQAQLESCLTQTTQSLQTMIDSGNALAPDLVAPMYCNGLRKAALFNAMKDKMLQSTSQAERNTIITSLGCTQDMNLLSNLLGMAIDSTVTLSNNEKTRILSAPMNNGEASVKAMLAFAKENVADLIPSGRLNSILNNIAARITNEELREEFVTFLSTLRGTNQITEGQSNVNRQSAATILSWQADNLGPIMEFFEVDGRATTTTLGAGSVVLSTAILALCAFVKQLF
jgi:aminopeptidase N